MKIQWTKNSFDYTSNDGKFRIDVDTWNGNKPMYWRVVVLATKTKSPSFHQITLAKKWALEFLETEVAQDSEAATDNAEIATVENAQAEPENVIDEPADDEAERLLLRERKLGIGAENGMSPHDVPDDGEPETAEELPPEKTEAWQVKPENLLIEMPMDGFSPEKLDNLFKIVTSKETLLKTAIGVSDLPIQTTADTIKFPWFAFNADHERVSAYTMLIAKICAAAKTKHRVLAKERDTTDNPKYAFRCWLLSLGFIGDEYKAARKILLANLGGDGSWKSGKKTAVEA